MVGFLLAQDAVEARKIVFDSWVDEQRRHAEQAAQAAQAAAARVAQEAAQRTDALRSAIAASAPPTPPEPPPAPTPPPQPVYAPPEAVAPTALQPEVQERTRQFDGWVAQQDALADLLQSAEPPGHLPSGFTAPLEGTGRFFEGVGTDIRRQQQEAQALNPYMAGVAGGGFGDPGTALTAGLERAGVPSPYREIVGGGAPLLLPSGAARGVVQEAAEQGGTLAQRALRSGMRTGPAREVVEELGPETETAASIARDVLTNRDLGQAGAMAAARLGGAVAGGVAGYASTPEEAGPVERIGRTLGGAGVGLAAPSVAEAAITRPQIQQDILESLRRGGVVPGPPMSSARTNLTGEVVDVTKQMMLSNPVGRALDVVGNTIELLRQPVALTMGGRGPEASAGLAALGRAIPEAAQNTADVLFRGQQAATLGAGASTTRGRDFIFRILGAGDMFTRTLGEYQGMASKGVQMLNDAGIPIGSPQADQFLAQHADELYRAGAQSGTTSVFGAAQGGQHATAIDQLMKRFGDFKESKINSPNLRDQAVGALLDLEVPFTGVPSRVWQIAIQRVPGITQVAGVARIGRALQKQDTYAASKALGELTMESMIQAQIAQGIRDGFITGPDDPEHPNSVQVNGAWLPLARFGVYGTPMAIMATFAESWQKTGREIDPETTDRFGAALNASMEPLMEALPGFTVMQTLAGLGRGGGTRAITDTAADAVTRLISPAFGAQVEHMVDPVVRDVATRGPHQLWEPAFAKNPFLARFLPPKIDPTTGEPMQRGYSVVGGMTKPSSPVRAELARLKRMGYALNPPDDRPSSITVRGVSVAVKNGTPEQRAMVAARGQELAKLGERMQQPSYAKMSDDQKARLWASMLDRSQRVQQRAWLQNVDPEVGAQLLAAGKRVVGRVRDVEDEDERINREVALANMLRRQRRDREREYEQQQQQAVAPRSPFAIG